MDERFCDIGGGMTLCYDTFGDEDAPPLLLVMGLATQMVAWHEDFCRALAGRGFRVIRFDNRDIGRSTHLSSVPPLTVGQLLRRDTRAAGYTLATMANDAVALLEHLGAAPAHVAGVSMGGMIAQTMAARRPAAVRSLASVMSTTGSRLVGQPAFAAYPVVLKTAPREREAFIEHLVGVFGVIGSPGFERDEQGLRAVAGLMFDRESDATGAGRQLAAILASGNRTCELRRVTAPTVVIHGSADRLIRPSGGRATARAIPAARLLMIDGLGHDLPRGAWRRVIDAIVDNARRAGFVPTTSETVIPETAPGRDTVAEAPAAA